MTESVQLDRPDSMPSSSLAISSSHDSPGADDVIPSAYVA